MPTCRTSTRAEQSQRLVNVTSTSDRCVCMLSSGVLNASPLLFGLRAARCRLPVLPFPQKSRQFLVAHSVILCNIIDGIICFSQFNFTTKSGERRQENTTRIGRVRVYLKPLLVQIALDCGKSDKCPGLKNKHLALKKTSRRQ